MRTLIVAAWVLHAVSCAGPVARDVGPPPNIVLIIGDDHGYRDLGFMGSAIAKTPNLDRLAAAGTVFPVGYSTASICRPALASLLTGLYPHQWDERVARLERSGSERPERERIRDFETLPRLLSRNGYATFQAGKYWEGTYEMGGFTHGMTDGSESDAQTIHSKGAEFAIVRQTMQPVYDFIRTHRTNPFFIWFAPVLPHRPHNAPAKYRSLYRDTPVANADLGYYANISWFDDGVGELVDFLDSAGLREQTLIIYVIDNGWTTGGSGGFGGLKGKGSLHEQGFRTPVVFNWPGRVPGGAVRESLVSIVDLFPTALDYAGLRTPADRPGGSLRPIIEGDADRVREFVVGEGDSVVWVKGEYGPVRGRYLRDERWHYIELLHRRPRLFDVTRDPDEVINVMKQHLDVVAESRRRIESELARHLEMLRD